MGGSCTPLPRARQLRLHRAALIGVVLFAGACRFAVTGVDAHDGADAGASPPFVTPPGTRPAFDLATPPDLATPLPGNVGDECAGSCSGGLACMNWVPNGYCSKTCDGSSTSCPAGSSCVDIGGGGGEAASGYCLVNANGGGNCMRPDLQCRDCNAKVCGPSTFCDGC